ncbi:hypothetical protein Drose_05650 [Dactylosporangium roseum]|uniref:Uncharacterized protein n=1 Tax=Dactylosporangium roseum TaxID=47989 RepID=A0ABY5ZBP6_9ACTN|nr:hypothetical protein [Dactylosporangium roseum]UWZ37754.1 hypothetical protein Drose_05650 [Dactylosporangium roseum]
MNVTAAYVRGHHPVLPGNLLAGGTLTVDGVTIDIPAGVPPQEPTAEEKLTEALAKVGYRFAYSYPGSVELPDDDGVFKVWVVPA